jgi:hypothetical protein
MGSVREQDNPCSFFYWLKHNHWQILSFLYRASFQHMKLKTNRCHNFNLYSYIDGSLHVSGPQAHPQENSHSCSHNHWFSGCTVQAACCVSTQPEQYSHWTNGCVNSCVNSPEDGPVGLKQVENRRYKNKDWNCDICWFLISYNHWPSLLPENCNIISLRRALVVPKHAYIQAVCKRLRRVFQWLNVYYSHEYIIFSIR